MELIFEKERAGVYDNFISNWMPGYELYMKLLPNVLKSSSKTVNNILSVGCGTGNELLAIHDFFPKAKIIGIDPSQEMIKIAKDKCVKFTNIEINKSTIDTFKFDTKFDAITLNLVLHFIPDNGKKLNFLKEIHKHLKPNGCFVLCDVFGSNEQINIQLEILKSIVSPTIKTNDELHKRLENIRNNFHYVDEKRLDDLLLEAGFNLPNKFFKSTIYNAWLITKK